MFERFTFRKFEPTPDISLYANTLLHQIWSLKPESSVWGLMTKFDDDYNCQIEMVLNGKTLRTNAWEKEWSEALRVADQAIRQLVQKRNFLQERYS